MFNAIVELFLTDYFVVTASVGRFVDNRKDLFFRLAKVFLISDSEANRLFKLCESAAVLDVVTEQDYLRHQRLQKYAYLTGDKTVINRDVEEVIRVKGNALISAAKQKLLFNPQNSRTAEYNSLLASANGGMVIALKALGFLQCEGIFLDKNVKDGVRNFAKVANWNDCVGTLAMLRYSSDNREYNASRLKMIVEGTPFERLFKRVCKAYNVKHTQDIPEVRLLNRAFDSAKLSRNVYNPMCARILYGDVLTLKDKEKAMFSSDAVKQGLLGDLPLKLSERRISAVDVNGLSAVALDRPVEQGRIATSLSNADLRAYEQYRPLCLASDSPYVLNMYARAICRQSELCRFEKINVADLTAYDLEPSSNNIFVRSVDEDLDNRFLMFFVGNVPDKTLDFVKSFLIGAKRAKFHLNTPNVTLNLGAVLPICFCDKRNARLLADIIDVVQLDDVTEAELPKAIADIIFSKKTFYGANIALKGSACEVFTSCTIDKAERIIDAVARDHRKDGKTIVISRETVNEYSFNFDSKRIGFIA